MSFTGITESNPKPSDQITDLQAMWSGVGDGDGGLHLACSRTKEEFLNECGFK